MAVFSSKRKFRTWLYTPSHGTLILRGAGAADDGRNIDLKFAGTQYAEIVPDYNGLIITRPTSQQILEYRTRLRLNYFENSDIEVLNGGYYHIESLGISYMIVASFFLIHYNNYSYDQVTAGEGEQVIG